MDSESLTKLLQKALYEYAENDSRTFLSDNLQPSIADQIPEFYQIDVYTGAMPFIAILDPEETQSFREGVYVSVLFEPSKNDHEAQVTLSLIQGVASVANDHQSTEEVLSERSKEITSSLLLNDLYTDVPTLPTATGIQKQYPAAIIGYKQYTLSELAETDDVQSDLDSLLQSYQQYVGRTTSGPEGEVRILNIGQSYISRWNLNKDRRKVYSVAFEEAVTKAIELNVDAVIQTGDLFGTQTPKERWLTHLETQLERLHDAEIPCYHTPSERGADMQAVDDLYESGLLTLLDTSPTVVGALTLYGKQPDETYEDVLPGLEPQEPTGSALLAGHQPVNPPVGSSKSASLTKLPFENTRIGALVVGRSDEAAAHQNQIDVFATGPTAPRITKRLVFEEHAVAPYPRTVSEITVQNGDFSQTLHELPHERLIVCTIRSHTDTHVNRIYHRLTEHETRDATIAIQLVSESEYDSRPNSLEELLEDEAKAVKVWHKQSTGISAEGVDIDINVYDETLDSDGEDTDPTEDVHIYQSKPVEDENYTQEVITHKLIGDAESGREVQPGENIVLLDTGRHEKEDNVLYGPFIAETDVETNRSETAWDGEYKYQVHIGWGQLYRANASDINIPLRDVDRLAGDDASSCISQLKTEGTKITVTDDGQIETADEPIDTESESDSPSSTEPESDLETGSGTTDMITLRDYAEPLDLGTAISDARQPGIAILQKAIDGELRPDLYRAALCHLVAGKNVIFYGPPGSGKTRIAKRLSYGICAQTTLATANAEWTYQQVVGGYRPTGDSFEPQPGILTKTAASCEDTLEENHHPSWLIIDELNRANLDEAFGEVFTLLDVDHRRDTPISYGDTQDGSTRQRVPLAFRILGTMNTQDQAQLFALGYAFRRRFAFLKVPALQSPRKTIEDDRVVTATATLRDQSQRARQIIRSAVIGYFTQPSPIDDTPFGIPELESVVFDSPTTVEEALNNLESPGNALTPDEALLSFVESLEVNDVAVIGQGIIIDALKYIVVAERLFPDEASWATVDEAVSSYILPQLEPFMSELRRAETMTTGGMTLQTEDNDTESDDDNPLKAFQAVQQKAAALGLAETERRLAEAEDTHQIIK